MSERRRWRRATAAGLLTAASALVMATWPSAASADAPVRTAWWNTVSGGGQSAPAPTAADGGLHIAVAPGQVLAFGAVLYSMPVDATATLELKVASQGTPVLVACPTKTSSWKEGGNQPSDAAPAYDCSTRSYTGSVSADGATVTFLVDGGSETTPGELSLAIVPYMTHDAPAGVGTQLPVDATPPFVADIAKPDASSLTITSELPLGTGSGSGGGGGGTQPGNTPATSGGGTTSTSGGSAGGAQVPPTLVDAPPADTTTAVDGAAPQVAPPATSTAPGALAPAAAAVPKVDNTAHNIALALLVLVAMAVIASGNTTMQRQPRLIGGGRRSAGDSATATAVAPVVVAGYGAAAVRGLGRFARERTAPPRPLV